MARSVSAWRRFWFPAIPVERVAVLRILLCSYVLCDLLFESRWMLRYANVAGDFYEPIFIIRALGLPRLGPEALEGVWLVAIIACLFALAGLRTRLALWVLAPLYLYWYATYHSYHWVFHFKVVPVVALFVLAVAPSGRAYSLDALRSRRDSPPASGPRSDELAGWACQFLIVLLCSLYCFSALQKLRFSGPDWWTGSAFDLAIAALGSPLARDLAEHHHWVVGGMALSVFAFEVCAPVLLFRTRLRLWYAGLAILFHAAALALLGLNFMGWAVVCTVVFPLERLPPYLRSVFHRRGATPPDVERMLTGEH